MPKKTTGPLEMSDEASLLYHILARANELASNTELDDLLDQMLDLIISVCEGNAGTLYLLDAELDELEIKVVKGPGSDQSLVRRRIKSNQGVAGATMQAAQPIVIEDLANDSRWQRLSNNQIELRNVVSIPLVLRG